MLLLPGVPKRSRGASVGATLIGVLAVGSEPATRGLYARQVSVCGVHAPARIQLDEEDQLIPGERMMSDLVPVQGNTQAAAGFAALVGR